MDGPSTELPGRLLDPVSNDGARGMIVIRRSPQGQRREQDSAYGALRHFLPPGLKTRPTIPRMKTLSCALLASTLVFQQPPAPPARATVVRAGRLVDPAA